MRGVEEVVVVVEAWHDCAAAWCASVKKREISPHVVGHCSSSSFFMQTRCDLQLGRALLFGSRFTAPPARAMPAAAAAATAAGCW